VTILETSTFSAKLSYVILSTQSCQNCTRRNFGQFQFVIVNAAHKDYLSKLFERMPHTLSITQYFEVGLPDDRFFTGLAGILLLI